MLVKARRMMYIIIGTTIGLYLGEVLYAIFHYIKNPGFYMLQSAPWYTSVQLSSIGYGAALLVELIIMGVIRHRLKKQNRQH